VLQQPAAEASGADFLSLQQQARTLADSGQFEAAEAAYLQLIQAFPEVAEPYGELGNLYLAADQAEKAAQAYLDAGKRIDPKLSPSQLEGLIQTLQTLSPDKAELLKQHLSQP
jgi:tetratricopeptide (TPR) repeat protein